MNPRLIQSRSYFMDVLQPGAIKALRDCMRALIVKSAVFLYNSVWVEAFDRLPSVNRRRGHHGNRFKIK